MRIFLLHFRPIRQTTNSILFLQFRETFIKARLFGIDLNKMTTKRNKDGSLCIG